MFHPTSTQLFRPVPALMKLKIHHPLPLSPRDSTALLNLLTSSFRKNLNAEHPISPAEEHTRTFAKSGKPVSRPSGTDMHFQSVLSNPLFTSPTKRSDKVPDNQAIAQFPAMETFERAVRLGMMDMRYATICLLATKNQIVASSVLNVRDGMKASGAGQKVLNWIRASALDIDLEFLKTFRFPVIFFEFLVAEGLQEAAWKWIKMSFDMFPASHYLTGHELRNAQERIPLPLYWLVRAEMLGLESLDAAYMCMSRAAAYLKGLPSKDIRPILSKAGYYILDQTLPTNTRRPSPTDTHFESFTGLLPTFLNSHTVLSAHLQLIHPSKPSADLAKDYLRKFHFTEEDLLEGMSSDQRNSIINLGLDTARFLLKHQDQQAHQKDVNLILHMLRTRFQEEMGHDDKTEQLEKVRAEATSLDLLARLGFS